MKIRDRSAAGGGRGRQSVPAPGIGAPLGGERLPVAPRERKPALAALAVLLILVGALGATLMVMRAGNKTSVVEVVRSVAAGELIPETAIREVMISEDSGISFVKWRQRNDLVNNYRAATNLVADSILSNSMITEKDEVLVPGKSIVGLSLKDSQFPVTLKSGDKVAAYHVGNDAENSQNGGGNATTAGDTPLINDHLIVGYKDSDSGGIGGGQTTVTVLVDTDDAARLTIAASAGEVALALVPNTGN